MALKGPYHAYIDVTEWGYFDPVNRILYWIDSVTNVGDYWKHCHADGVCGSSESYFNSFSSYTVTINKLGADGVLSQVTTQPLPCDYDANIDGRLIVVPSGYFIGCASGYQLQRWFYVLSDGSFSACQGKNVWGRITLAADDAWGTNTEIGTCVTGCYTDLLGLVSVDASIGACFVSKSDWLGTVTTSPVPNSGAGFAAQAVAAPDGTMWIVNTGGAGATVSHLYGVGSVTNYTVAGSPAGDVLSVSYDTTDNTLLFWIGGTLFKWDTTTQTIVTSVSVAYAGSGPIVDGLLPNGLTFIDHVTLATSMTVTMDGTGLPGALTDGYYFPRWFDLTGQIVWLQSSDPGNGMDVYGVPVLGIPPPPATPTPKYGILQTAFQSEPYPIFWATRADGQLIGLVFNRQDDVFAWFRVNLLPGGGFIESVAVISGQGQEDMIAVSVRRVINGTTVRYVEYFMPQELFSQLSNAFFVHCGLQLNLGTGFNITNITQANPCVVTAPGHTFVNGDTIQITDVLGMTEINQDKTEAYTVSSAAANTFEIGMDTTGFHAYIGGGVATKVANQVTGMSYLLGQTVVAVGDGALILPPTVVNSDVLNFMFYCNQITVGIPYQMTVQPTNPIFNTPTITTRGFQQKLNKVVLSLYQSMGGQFGTDLDNMYDITYGTGTKGQTPTMATLETLRDMDADWSDKSTFYIIQSDPFPFTLRGLTLHLNFNAD